MKRHRRQFSADWKAKIALEAIKGQRTVQEIASHYEIHPNVVTRWKKQLLDRAAEIFSSGKTQEGKADEGKIRDEALTDKELLAQVVKHKQTLYLSGWTHYETAMSNAGAPNSD
jgi:transposase